MSTARKSRIPLLRATLAMLVCAATVGAADAPIQYKAVPNGNTVLIQGTSTLHPWEMKGLLIGGSMEIPAGVVFDTNQATIPGLKDGKLSSAVKVNIPVRTIRSEADHLPEYMERLMQEHLKATNFATISYHASELELQTPHKPGEPFTFDAAGELAIAGVTNKVDFPVTISPVDADKIKVHGQTKLKMTSYGVTPPAPDFGLGMMKCGDEVTIIFDWTLQQKSAPNAPAPAAK